MNYYGEIKNRLTEEEIYARVKDYSKERHKVDTYYEVGKILSEAGKHYGENIIGKYAIRLQKEVGKKYDKTMLSRMRQLYFLLNNAKVAPLGQQLTWSHYRELIPIKDMNAVKYYIKICEERHLSRDKLREKIKSKEYERLPKETKEKILYNDNISTITDYIKNPIIIKNKYKEKINEKLLQRLILENISSFLKELGNGFSFIDNEYKIKIGENYNYIDLLLFNYVYNAFIVVELKVVPLKKEHIGQIEIYMNYVDKHIKNINHDKTIGLIITRKNNQFILEYTSDKRVLVKEYKLI